MAQVVEAFLMEKMRMKSFKCDFTYSLVPFPWDEASNYIDGSVQDCSISIANNTLGILQSCTEPSIYSMQQYMYNKERLADRQTDRRMT